MRPAGSASAAEARGRDIAVKPPSIRHGRFLVTARIIEFPRRGQVPESYVGVGAMKLSAGSPTIGHPPLGDGIAAQKWRFLPLTRADAVGSGGVRRL
jgi:hypothetical protein